MAHLRHLVCLFLRIKFRALSREIRETRLRGYSKLNRAFFVQKGKSKREAGKATQLKIRKYMFKGCVQLWEMSMKKSE